MSNETPQCIVPGYYPDPESLQKPVVKLTKQLVEDLQGVLWVYADLELALKKNRPPLTISEASDLWRVFQQLSTTTDVRSEQKRFFGEMCRLLESLFPGESFGTNNSTRVDPAFHPDGLNSNQNAAVGMVRELKEVHIRKNIADACPNIQAALDANDPALTVDEAHEVWSVVYPWYCEYYGHLEIALQRILETIEALFPEEVFSKT